MSIAEFYFLHVSQHLPVKQEWQVSKLVFGKEGVDSREEELGVMALQQLPVRQLLLLQIPVIAVFNSIACTAQREKELSIQRLKQAGRLFHCIAMLLQMPLKRSLKALLLVFLHFVEFAKFCPVDVLKIDDRLEEDHPASQRRQGSFEVVRRAASRLLPLLVPSSPHHATALLNPLQPLKLS